MLEEKKMTVAVNGGLFNSEFLQAHQLHWKFVKLSYMYFCMCFVCTRHICLQVWSVNQKVRGTVAYHALLRIVDMCQAWSAIFHRTVDHRHSAQFNSLVIIQCNVTLFKYIYPGRALLCDRCLIDFPLCDVCYCKYIGAIHKRRRQFLAIFDPSPLHIDPYRLFNVPPFSSCVQYGCHFAHK